MKPSTMLSEDGPIAEKLTGYEVRPEQLEMADAVAQAFLDSVHLIVEAGTGVGKTFAYLVPAIDRVIQHGGRVVISTHTIALQEQLFDQDIPFLKSVFPKEFSAVLVKGRANYLGLRRLTRASSRKTTLFGSEPQLEQLHAIEDWAYKTTDGSLADLDHQPDPAVWDLIRSDGDDCLGRKCPQYGSCFYQRARRKAASAQLLIVNHALLFADLAVRQQGASILPDYEYLILDEAHTVEQVAGNHLGLSLSNAQFHYLLSRLYNPKNKRGVLARNPGKSVIPAVTHAQQVVHDYFGMLAAWHLDHGEKNGRIREPIPIEQRVSTALLEVRDQLLELRKQLDDDDDRSEILSYMDRIKDFSVTLDQWHQCQAADWVYWITVKETPRFRVTLNARPIDVGPILQEQLFKPLKSVILTSATLTTESQKPFAYLSKRIGLEEKRTKQLGSPFDFESQLKVYVEADLPNPANTALFLPAACEAIKKYVNQTEGHAFVLFTSYRMMQDCAQHLERFFDESDMSLLVQGEGYTRTQMLDEFRNVPHSVLFGTDTFWTGVDVPGEALTNVIIVKLPFAVPNEPVTEARIERIREEGGNPFMSFQIPEAVLKFRQGIGRLIRSKSDRGIIVILDPRVVSKPYGRRFLEAIPPCQVVVNQKQAGVSTS